MENLEIGGKYAAAGKKSFSYLRIQDDDAGTVRLLVGVVAGAEPGPVLSITGGMYGTIYTGIDACIRIHDELDPNKLKGTVVTVPVVEITGFQQCMDYSPMDLLNPNRVFPGDPHGTITFRIAYALFNEVIKKSNCHLDLRGGDLWEELLTFTIFYKTGRKDFDDKTEKMARALGTEYYVITDDTKGSLVCEASKAGIHSIILEASRGLATYNEEDIQSNMISIRNLLKHLGMMEGNPEIPTEWKREETQIHILKTEKGGLVYLNCKCGEKARKGQKLGEIKNLRGETLQELTAPVDGIIHYIFPKHVKRPGERIVGMRRIL